MLFFRQKNVGASFFAKFCSLGKKPLEPVIWSTSEKMGIINHEKN
jgi:hypothetical protein